MMHTNLVLRSAQILKIGVESKSMIEKITLNYTDLQKLMDTLKEFEVNHFSIIKTGGSGIGYEVDLEFHQEFKGRMATIRIPITTTDEW